MAAIEIKKNVTWVGALDWDRRLFDELIPLPDGTSYNSYLVRGSEKTALIDTVDPAKTGDLLDNLQEAGRDPHRLHRQPARRAGPLRLHRRRPGNIPRGPGADQREMQGHAHGPAARSPKAGSRPWRDGETLDLGDKTLEFIFAPWVHWPETMLTYLREDKILFSCDFLGAHLAAEPTVA